LRPAEQYVFWLDFRALWSAPSVSCLDCSLIYLCLEPRLIVAVKAEHAIARRSIPIRSLYQDDHASRYQIEESPMNRSPFVVAAFAMLTAASSAFGSESEDALVKVFLETKSKAAAGNVDAQYKLASLHSSGKGVKKNDAEAVKWYRRVAEQKDARGQSMLGVMYTNARGVKRDYDKAIVWFQKAAAQNSAHAKYNLGYMYAVGKGVKRDPAKSADWYRQAAELNDAGSQRILGSLYAAGRGVDKDLTRACAWTTVVLPRGGAAAKKQLMSIESQMTPDQITAARKMAKDIAAKLAKLARAAKPAKAQPVKPVPKK
jgi:TPR repeat protein